MLFDHLNHDLLLDKAFFFVQVFERRSPADPCQKRGERVLRRAKVDMGYPWHPAHFVQVASPEVSRGPQNLPAPFREMKRLAKEVGEAETDVKRRVSEMKHLMIEQN